MFKATEGARFGSKFSRAEVRRRRPPCSSPRLSMRALLFAAALLYISAEAAADSRPIPLVCFEDPALADHKGVAVALRALGHAATVVPHCPGNHDAAGASAAMLPTERVVRVVLDPAMPSQHYELHADRLNGGDLNGLIYGLLELPKLWQESAPGRQSGGPAFTSRVYSIEGQYLDLPDVAYYSTTPPYLNTSLIEAEAAAIARGLPTLVRNSEMPVSSRTICRLACVQALLTSDVRRI